MSEEKCARCGEVGEDRRTLWMACFYAMEELDIPFEQRTLANIQEGPKPAGAIGGRELKFPDGLEMTMYDQHMYTLRVCKACRADWMEFIRKWWLVRYDGMHDKKSTGTGVFVRRNGINVELTEDEVEQWRKEHGGAEPIKVVQS